MEGLQMIAFREGQNLLNLLLLKFQGKVKTRLEDNQYSEAYQGGLSIFTQNAILGNGFGKPSQIEPVKGAFIR